MTVRLIFWILGFLILLLAQHLGEFALLKYLLLFALALPILSFIELCWQRYLLLVQVETQVEQLERLAEAKLDLLLRNRFFFPVQIRAELLRPGARGQELLRHQFQLYGRESVRLRLLLTAEHVGRLQIGELHLALQDRLKFFNLKMRTQRLEQTSCLVLPLIKSTAQHDAGHQPLEEGFEPSQQKSQTLTDEIERMRPFASGDRLKMIHWKLSARMQRWMVRQYERADERCLTILLECPVINDQSTKADWFLRDWLLEQVSGDLRNYLQQAYQLRLYTTMPERLLQEAERLQELESLRLQLAMLPLSGQTPLARQIDEQLAEARGRVFCLYATGLDRELVSSLKSLQQEAAAVFMNLFYRNLPSEDERRLLRELSALGLKIRVQQALERYDEQ